MNTAKGWWFSKGYKLPYGDGRIIKLGKTHQIKGEIIPCENGLHASERIIDALSYAQGSLIWKVELSGTVIKERDKLCASSRKYLSGGVDCSDVLGKFARLCALDVIESWDAPQVVIDYLKTGDEKLRNVASNAAWSAAESVAWSTAESAARSAARFAAKSVAWHAARSAAKSVASNAAKSATENTTWNAAWDATWDAAWSAKNKRLTVMINKFIKFQGFQNET